MKRSYQKIAALCVSACLCSAVLAGCKDNSNEAGRAEPVTEVQLFTQTEAAEEAFMEQAASDAEQIEKQGNIYDGSEYRKHGGFGYQITALRLYDTYDELQIRDYDERKACEPAYYYPEASYACLEIQVTNEGGVEKTLYPSAIHLGRV